MVVQGPLDNNTLGHDYISNMGAIVSTLFRVVCLPHGGRMVQFADQLSFLSSNTATSQTPSLNGLFAQGMSIQPLVHPPNYHE